MTYKDFTEMPVWQLSMEAAEMVFNITNDLPRKEDYGLTSQIRRAIVSVSSNIAEAFGRSSSADKSRFYDFARGSASETKSLLLYGQKVGYFSESGVQAIIDKLDIIVHNINKVKMALMKSQPQPQP